MSALMVRKFHFVLALFVAVFAYCGACHATPILLTSSDVASTVLAPSSDTLSLTGQNVYVDTDSASPVVFQTGDFILGDSEIPDQTIPFTFQDTITLDGETGVLDIIGQNDVTTTADTLTLYAQMPLQLGSEVFTLQPFTLSGDSIGQDLPISLEATVTPAPTPEPGSLVLLASGLLIPGIWERVRRARASRKRAREAHYAAAT